jgi:hypothetical protein
VLTSLRTRTLLRFLVVVGAATLAAILELAVARALPAGAPRPHVALIVVSVVAVVGGLEMTAVAALAGGLALDALAFRPLGVTPLGLLLAGGATAALASPFAGVKRTVGLAAVVPADIGLGLAALLDSPGVNAAQAAWRLAPGAALDLSLACPLAALGLALRRRAATEVAPSQ